MNSKHFRIVALGGLSLVALALQGTSAMAKPVAHPKPVDTMVNMTMPLASYPLIARQDLFGNPVKSSGRLSPDGKYVSYLAPRDGVMNIWVASAATPDKAKPISGSKDRPIRQYFWAPDSSADIHFFVGEVLYVGTSKWAISSTLFEFPCFFRVFFPDGP